MKTNQRYVIFGTGPLGMAVMEELTAAGRSVRMVNRSGQADVPAGVEVVAADASNPEEAAQVCQEAGVVFHCANTEYEDWVTLFPLLTRGILAGASQANARLVFGDNLYGYGPDVQTMKEDSPRRPVGNKPAMRAEMEDLLLSAHKNGDLEVAIAKASDFYGPRALGTHMGDRVFPNLLQGKAASVIGDPDQPHTFTYIRDFARLMVLLAERPEASGQVWHVPSAETLTTGEFIRRAAKLAGVEAKISAMPLWMHSLLAVFIPILKELKEVRYQFDQPFIVDGSKAVNELGFSPTPLEAAIMDTWDWYRSR